MSSLSRDEAARRFAEVSGLDISLDLDALPFPSGMVVIPAPDAPLHEKLAFVGRIAEAGGPIVAGEFAISLGDGGEWTVWLSYDWKATAPDLVYAALLAGIAAKEAK